MPDSNGIWTLEEAQEHFFSQPLGDWLVEHLDRHRLVHDIGCGRGAYAQHLAEQGFTVMAWEGTENIETISHFKPIRHCDLSTQIPDVYPGQAICLEVGEHIPVEFEETVFDNLNRFTGDVLILSWAVPGQEGTGHVNCRTNEYVSEQLAKRGLHLDTDATASLRRIDFSESCGWFANTLMLFRRAAAA